MQLIACHAASETLIVPRRHSHLIDRVSPPSLSSTSPWAWSQAAPAPSAASRVMVCSAVPCGEPFGDGAEEGVHPFPAQRRKRDDVVAAGGFREDAASPPRRPADRACSRPRSSARLSPTPISVSTFSTSARCASLSGWAMSRTWMIRSAEITSSSVARKAATSWVGRSETKPTVSDRIALSTPGSEICAHGRIERREEQVLRHDVGAGQAVEQGRFAGIGVADQRDHRPGRALAAGAVEAAGARDLLQLAPQLAPCGRGSAGGRPRSGSRRGRRGSRSRRAAARGGSRSGPAARPDNRDGRARPAAGPPRSPPARRKFRGSARCGRSPWPWSLLQILLLDRRDRGVDDDQFGLRLRTASAICSTWPEPNRVAGLGWRMRKWSRSSTATPIAPARPAASSSRASASRRASRCRGRASAITARAPRRDLVVRIPVEDAQPLDSSACASWKLSGSGCTVEMACL